MKSAKSNLANNFRQSDITATIAEKKQEQILLTETKNLRAELSRK